MLNDVVLNQVVFKAQTPEQTKRVLDNIQSSGVLWLGPTTWKGEYAMRISVSSAATGDADVLRSIEAIHDAVAQANVKHAAPNEKAAGGAGQ